jgi:tryptophanyl-tRNA synthetase
MDIVVSGMRPTGRLHIGHYFGAIRNWVKLQEQYRCYFFVADWHALTTHFEDTSHIKEYSREMVLDWIASGIDLEKSVIFVQSLNPYHSELFLLLSMITPVSWLERCPTYKEVKQEMFKEGKDLSNYGFLGYPVLMTADIILYDAKYVPVGIDQLPHIELSREVVRRFNFYFGENLFLEPEAYITESPKIPGTDGRKMSKSYNNAIWLHDDLKVVEKKILTMVTDTNRKRKIDTGDPDKCPVFDYHKVFSTDEEKTFIVEGCTTAKIGCIDCKKILLRHLIEFLNTFHAKRLIISEKYNNKDLYEILDHAQNKAIEKAYNKINTIREALKF